MEKIPFDRISAEADFSQITGVFNKAQHSTNSAPNLSNRGIRDFTENSLHCRIKSMAIRPKRFHNFIQRLKFQAISCKQDVNHRAELVKYFSGKQRVIGSQIKRLINYITGGIQNFFIDGCPTGKCFCQDLLDRFRT